MLTIHVQSQLRFIHFCRFRSVLRRYIPVLWEHLVEFILIKLFIVHILRSCLSSCNFRVWWWSWDPIGQELPTISIPTRSEIVIMLNYHMSWTSSYFLEHLLGISLDDIQCL